MPPIQILRVVVLLGFVTLAALLAQLAFANPEPPPPPPPPPECTSNWCQVVQFPGGSMTFGEVVVWPEEPICLGGTVYASPNMDSTCGDAITASVWANATTNCPTTYATNTMCPYSVTNWWVANGPGSFQASGGGLGTGITPTNCGQGTITFYNVWTNYNPCTGTSGGGGGTITAQATYKVTNVDIVESQKILCACDTGGFTLTNSCPDVTWEVVSQELPGEPTVSGSSIVAGTNCGSWTVIARSTENTNCVDYATVTVVTAQGFSGMTGTLINENPPTYLVCPVPTNSPSPFLEICANFCPGLEESDLPDCVEVTGGLETTNRLCRKVDLRELGTTTITATAGCSSQSVVIMVADTNAPTIYCPGDIYWCNDYGNCSALLDLSWFVSASDDCGPVNLSFSPDNYEWDVGEHLITATATDVAGNTVTCSFNLIVLDCDPPTIQCPEDIEVYACGATNVTWELPLASDNCGVSSVNCSPASGSVFSPGATTVTCTAFDAAGNQRNCTFTVTVVAPQAEVTNIKFNHDTSSSTADAINIRQDFSTAYDISNGEWITGGANLPVCYTINNAVNIKVRLTVQPPTITSADVWAVSTDTNGSLNNVVKKTVTFSGGVSNPEYVTFAISGTTPGTIAKTTSDAWAWKLENVNGSGSSACDLNTTGPHTVYTILAEPTDPWDNTVGSQKNAWKNALDFAIVTCNAGGNTTEDSAMDAITTHLYTIPYHGASQCLMGDGYFSYTSYMTTTLANCLDSAVGLDTSGSLLGMDMIAKRRTQFFNFNFHCFVKKGGYVYDSCSAMNFCIIKMVYADYIAAGTPGSGSVESDETYPIK